MISSINRALNKMSNAQKTALVIGALASALVIIAALIAPTTSAKTGIEVSFMRAACNYGLLAALILMPMTLIIKQTQMVSIINRALAELSRVQMTPRVIGALASALVILAALIAPPTNIVTGMEVSFFKAFVIYGFLVIIIMMPMAAVTKQAGHL